MIKSIPPKGVINANDEISIDVMLFVDNKQIDPEKNKTPNTVNMKVVFFNLSEIPSVEAKNNKNKA